MMIKIWGRNTSSNVQKVMWAIGEIDLPHQRIDVGGAFGKNREPPYLAINPNGLVPTLEEEDGFTLWESNSIVRYLAARHANRTLEPADLRTRALAPQVDGLAALGDEPGADPGVLGTDPHPAGQARSGCDRRRQGQDRPRPRDCSTRSLPRPPISPATPSPTATSGRDRDVSVHAVDSGAPATEPGSLVRRDLVASRLQGADRHSPVVVTDVKS